MTSLILIRFHSDVERFDLMVPLLKRLNPGLTVHGAYGGGGYDKPLYQALWKHLHTMYVSPMPALWNWLNGDLVLRAWYKAIGFAIPFDRIYYVEGDLLLAAPLEAIYAHVPEDSLGLTHFTSVRAATAENWTWTCAEPWKTQWSQLLDFAKRNYNYSAQPNCCAFPGTAFPRAFLERYARMDVPELGNDELRTPLYAQLMGIPCVDTRLYPADESEQMRVFNADKCHITEATVREELAKPDGRRVFHPYNGRLDLVWEALVKSM